MGSSVADDIFRVNLGIKPGMRVLVFNDYPDAKEDLPGDETKRRQWIRSFSREVYETGRSLCIATHVEYASLGGHGKEPPEEIWRSTFGNRAIDALKKEALLDRLLTKTADDEDARRSESIISGLCEDAPDAIVALSNYSTSHTRFRDFSTRVCGARYASMPLFDEAMLKGAMTADWTDVEKRTKRLCSLVDSAETVVITSHNGTSISFSVKGRDFKPDTGILTKPGSFGNLPAGEAFCAPVEGTADGLLILEWAPTRKLNKPVSLKVKGGLVVDVDGKDELADFLRSNIEANKLCANIAELGIGTNDRAERPDNILETEKILGTIHIALGDNSSFGGRTSVPFHQDFIFFKPNVEVFRGDERIEVLVEGEPRF